MNKVMNLRIQEMIANLLSSCETVSFFTTQFSKESVDNFKNTCSFFADLSVASCIRRPCVVLN